MTSELVKTPRFHHAQRVRFLGGEGVVQNRKFEAFAWTYLVEMALGPEPNFGRVGAETMLVFTEADLSAA